MKVCSNKIIELLQAPKFEFELKQHPFRLLPLAKLSIFCHAWASKGSALQSMERLVITAQLGFKLVKANPKP